jgi:hypothetical protein
MQNTYNSPQQQMLRFQQAGLNKNLIYGQGSSGQAGSTAQTSQADIETPELFQDYADTRMKTQQTDNLKLQADQITAQTALTAAQEMQAISNTKATDFNREYLEKAQVKNLELLNNRVDNMYYSTDKMMADSARSERKRDSDEKTAILSRKLMKNQDALKAYDVLVAKYKAKGLKITAEAIQNLLTKFGIK